MLEKKGGILPLIRPVDKADRKPPRHEYMNLLKVLATVSSMTVVSRVLGFVRDMFMAAALGTGPVEIGRAHV